jgi:hypothetical protein
VHRVTETTNSGQMTRAHISLPSSRDAPSGSICNMARANRANLENLDETGLGAGP